MRQPLTTDEQRTHGGSFGLGIKNLPKDSRKLQCGKLAAIETPFSDAKEGCRG
jgi:hypothetical protein